MAGIEYILGLKIRNNILTIEPCVPDYWDSYDIQYKFGESIYNIKIKNIYKTNKIQSFIFNNVVINEKRIKLIDNNMINEIEIII